jgi:hypothetical protein
MELSEIREVRCPTCINNDWICGNNPLHVLFKYMTHTEEGRDSVRFNGKSLVYTWFMDGYHNTNFGKVNYVVMRRYYQGLAYTQGRKLRRDHEYQS